MKPGCRKWLRRVVHQHDNGRNCEFPSESQKPHSKHPKSPYRLHLYPPCSFHSTFFFLNSHNTLPHAHTHLLPHYFHYFPFLFFLLLLHGLVQTQRISISSNTFFSLSPMTLPLLRLHDRPFPPPPLLRRANPRRHRPQRC